MRYKPQSPFDKVMDVSMRGTYASANITEFLMGQSPYDNPLTAAWKGLTGHRRTTYSDLTGGDVSGITLDIALDPVTYLPFGAITKGARAVGLTKGVAALTTKLPSNIARVGGRMAMSSGRAAQMGAHIQRFGTKWDDAYKVIASTLKGGLADPNHLLKVASGWDEAVDIAKGQKVPRELLKHVEAGGKLTPDLITKYKITDEAVGALRGIERTADMISTVADKKFLVKGLWEQMRADIRPLYKSLKALEKSEPKKVKHILEALERSLPEARKIAGSGRKAWGMTDEFYDIVKKGGLITDDEIQIIQKQLLPYELFYTPHGVGQLEMFDDAMRTANKLKGVTATTPTSTLAYQLPEFRMVMEKAAANLSPDMGEVMSRYIKMKRVLGEEILKKGMFTHRQLQQFAADLGLTHVKHLPMDDLKRIVNTKSLELRTKMMERAEEIADFYVMDLANRGGIPIEKIKDMRGKFFDAIKKVVSLDEKELLAAGDVFDDFLGSARLLAADNPGAAMALKKLVTSMDELHHYRKYMGTINRFNKLNKGKMFETNLANIMVAEEMKMKTALIWHDTLREMTRKFPHVMQRITKGVEYDAKKWVKVSDNLLGDFIIRKEHARSFARVFDIASDTGGAFSKFVKAWDSGTGVWKYTTLIPFGKFHIRNFVSEILLSYNGGMPFLAKEYGQAVRLIYKVKVLKDPDSIKLYNSLVKRGVIKTGFFSSELGTTGGMIKTAIDTPFVERGILGKIKGVPGLKQYLNTMERVGEFTEDMPRIAQYLYGMRKGKKFMQSYGMPLLKGTKEEMAAMYVRAFHPVYDNFTHFEHTFVKRLFPFWSWYRFNIPLQCKLFIENPKHYARLEKVRRAITDMRGGRLPSETTPEWVQKGYAVGWGGKGGNQKYFLMQGWNPETEISRILTPTDIKDTFLQVVHPVKAIFEVAWGRDTFRNRPIPAYPGEKKEAFGLRIDPRVHHLLSTIRTYNDLNRLLWKDRDKGWEKVMFALFGKSYDVDTARASRKLKYHITREVLPKLKYGIEQARKNKDIKTYKKLRLEYRKLKRQTERL